MLVLSRRPGEVIRIGNDVVLRVVEIKDAQVKLGIEAPKNIPIHREEVFQAIQNGKGKQV